MSNYLYSVYYTTPAYKYRMHYEMIVLATWSDHYKKSYGSRRMGNEPLKENGLYPSRTKIPIKYNYWDYVNSFNKALLYENANKKHSLFIKICSHGPSVKILPEPCKRLYSEWVDISPKLINLEQDNIFIEEFSIPWIMKWYIEVDNTSEGFPCL
ncbi:hypothetical protein H5410_041507 [Solanum commersonii]|uniref:Uncharacterized protein n=1 Tax=Solanum commersonii TaxID=4109 RepID=A0A9J5XS25_SOLCO|nr:hypothetical protein H5410_041507 [Solanum commersonii]